MIALFEEKLKDIEKICKKRGVSRLYSFGSVNTNQFNKNSDIDLIVEFKIPVSEEYADNYLDMCHDLESILNRKVDLITARSIKNPIFKNQVETTRQLIFQD